jgi:hypothetical protein
VGNEWSHFGHVKPVSDIMCDWTVLDKNTYDECMVYPQWIFVASVSFILGLGILLVIAANSNQFSFDMSIQPKTR